MKTQKQVIIESYGDYWEKLNESAKKCALNNDGWINSILDHAPKEIELDFDEYIYRPKTLQGIDTNNGWLKIESEADLPEGLIDTGAQVWLSRNKIPFLGYFYRAYGGLNYNVHDLDSTPEEIQGIHIGSYKLLDGWQPINILPPKY